MAQLYKDTLPCNANIVIDYDAHERVKFSYPKQYSYWQAVWKMGRLTVTTFWLAVNIKAVYYLVIGLFFYIFIYFLDNISLTNITMNSIMTIDWMPLFWAMFILFYLFGIPIIVTYMFALNKNLLSSALPIMGYKASKMFSRANRKIFKPHDVINNTVMIPIFNNVYLHYKCYGQFDKYLKKIEIMAIPFKYSTKKKGYKEKEEEFEFSAVFHFYKVPKKGELDVRFI